jgi:hypothetical protein
MGLREPTPKERKEIKGLMDWLSRTLWHRNASQRM